MLLSLCGPRLLQRQGHTAVGVEVVRKVVDKLLRDANMSPRAQRFGIVKFSSTDASPNVFVTEFFNIFARVISTMYL